MRDVAIVVDSMPDVTICTDRYNKYPVAMAAAGAADYLVSGDKHELLVLGLYLGTGIMTVRDFLAMNKRLPGPDPTPKRGHGRRRRS